MAPKPKECFMTRAIYASLITLTCAALVGCNDGGSGGKATPQATFDSFKSAMKAKDYTPFPPGKAA
jgi:hypothetical protein